MDATHDPLIILIHLLSFRPTGWKRVPIILIFILLSRFFASSLTLLERRRYSWARPIAADKNDLDIILAFANYFVIYGVYSVGWMYAYCRIAWELWELWEFNTELEGPGGLESVVKGMLSPVMVALTLWRF
ncbi:hypothetical protein IFR05_012669 [Cadophora sp. M221]|nr:hypothetical protein IFR05_012669 [Cadophora sp. M221]